MDLSLESKIRRTEEAEQRNSLLSMPHSRCIPTFSQALAISSHPLIGPHVLSLRDVIVEWPWSRGEPPLLHRRGPLALTLTQLGIRSCTVDVVMQFNSHLAVGQSSTACPGPDQSLVFALQCPDYASFIYLLLGLRHFRPVELWILT